MGHAMVCETRADAPRSRRAEQLRLRQPAFSFSFLATVFFQGRGGATQARSWEYQNVAPGFVVPSNSRSRLALSREICQESMAFLRSGGNRGQIRATGALFQWHHGRRAFGNGFSQQMKLTR